MAPTVRGAPSPLMAAANRGHVEAAFGWDGQAPGWHGAEGEDLGEEPLQVYLFQRSSEERHLIQEYTSPSYTR